MTVHGRRRVFVAYVREDRPRVSKLVSELERAGLEVWWDYQILGGREWKKVIAKRIQMADVFVACFSEAYAIRQETYMDTELSMAVEEYSVRSDGRVWILPVLFSRCKLPDISIPGREDCKLCDLQSIDLSGADDTAIRRLIESILQPEEEALFSEDLHQGAYTDAYTISNLEMAADSPGASEGEKLASISCHYSGQEPTLPLVVERRHLADREAWPGWEAAILLLFNDALISIDPSHRILLAVDLRGQEYGVSATEARNFCRRHTICPPPRDTHTRH